MSAVAAAPSPPTAPAVPVARGIPRAAWLCALAALVNAVWDLYAEAVRRFGRVPAVVEWDDHVPELERVIEESRAAAAVEARALAAREGRAA